MPYSFDQLSTSSSGAGSETKILKQQHLQHFQQIMPAVASSHLIVTSSNVHPKNPCTTSTITTSSTLLLNITPDISVAVGATTPTSVATSYSSVSSATTLSSSCESGILSGSGPLTSSLNNSLLSTPSIETASLSTKLSLGPEPSSDAVVAGVTNSLTAPVIATVDSNLQHSGLTAFVTSQTPNSLTATVTSTLPFTAKTHAVAVTTASDSTCTGALPAATLAIVSPSLSSPSSSTSSSPSLAASRVPGIMSAPSASAQLLLNGLVAAGCVRDVNTQQQHQHYQHQILADDPRALQLALELSMVSLTEAAEGVSVNNSSTNNATLHLPNYQQQLAVHQHQKQQHHHLQQEQSQPHQQQYHSQQFDLSTLNVISAAVAAAASANNNSSNSNNINSSANANASNNSNSGNHTLSQFPVSAALLPTIEDRSKKSQNMTECVPVPSSEHVAEIVGRQGCKIKALRAKTNTYIKTPVRNEEPVFVVTGRKEDVAKAKREILSAAEHFSLIRATRKPSIDGALSGSGSSGTGSGGVTNSCGKTPPGPPSIPGQVTIQVRVPYRVVGLVVGPKGATIKHIQQETQTYIVTPSREKEPIFEVTGLPDNVQAARKQIEAHIALRTGNLPLNNGSSGNTAMMPTISDTLASVHNLNALSQILSDATDPDLLATLYKTDSIRSAFDYLENGNNITAAAAAAAVSSIVSPNGLNSSSINFNIGNSGGVDSNNMVNQLLMSSLGNCNNIQSQNLNGTHHSNDYLNNLITNCNLGSGGGSLVTDVGDMILQHQSHPSSSINAHMQQQQQQQVQLVGAQVHGSFIGSANSYSALNTTAINTINLTGITNGANTTFIGTGTNMHTMGNGAQNNSHHSGGIIGMTRSCSSASSTTSSKSANNSGSSSNNSSSSRPELMNIWKNLGDSLDVDEGIGDSPSIWALPTPLTALTGSHCSPSTSISPTDSLLGEISAANHHNHGLNHLITQHEIGSQKNLHLQQQNQQLNCDNVQQNVNMASMRRECLVCSDKEVTAVLVPCGHNMFCMECANRICSSGDATCPVCSLTVYHAMRILA